jgi:ABC-type multidrug transport system fused ATPase/permease subunit
LFRVFDLIDAKANPDHKTGARDARMPFVPTPREKYTGITFTNVNFAYKRRPTHRVLNNLTLSIKPNSITAVVGKSGSGKSTIMSILAGLHQIDSGTILINGTSLKDKSRDWVRSQVGVVEQTANLLSGTIAENIAYGKVIQKSCGKSYSVYVTIYDIGGCYHGRHY